VLRIHNYKEHVTRQGRVYVNECCNTNANTVLSSWYSIHICNLANVYAYAVLVLISHTSTFKSTITLAPMPTPYADTSADADAALDYSCYLFDHLTITHASTWSLRCTTGELAGTMGAPSPGRHRSHVSHYYCYLSDRPSLTRVALESGAQRSGRRRWHLCYR
jgi:hypothetical protein